MPVIFLSLMVSLFVQGDDLTKYGRLVLEDSFRVVGARDPRQVFLFEKLLLVTKHREDGKYSYKNDFEVGLAYSIEITWSFNFPKF